MINISSNLNLTELVSIAKNFFKDTNCNYSLMQTWIRCIIKKLFRVIFCLIREDKSILGIVTN